MTESLSANEPKELVPEGARVIGVDVDTQVDFAKEEGALYVQSTSEVMQNLKQLTQQLSYIIGSADSHAYDAWEFKRNGGPFPSHCVKGTEGWLRIPETRLDKDGNELETRFIPIADDFYTGETQNSKNKGPQEYNADRFALEVLGSVHVIFEKEVYSAFFNPLAKAYIAKLVEQIGGTRKALFAVYGFCTGGYCVDAFAGALKKQGYNTAIVTDATAAIDFDPESGAAQDGAQRTAEWADEKGILRLTTNQVLSALDSHNHS